MEERSARVTKGVKILIIVPTHKSSASAICSRKWWPSPRNVNGSVVVIYQRPLQSRPALTAYVPSRRIEASLPHHLALSPAVGFSSGLGGATYAADVHPARRARYFEFTVYYIIPRSDIRIQG